jgi:hypothetical protein
MGNHCSHYFKQSMQEQHKVQAAANQNPAVLLLTYKQRCS